MRLDVLYLAWNRLEFTKRSWAALLENTDWDLVTALYVYDDGSEDGTAFWLSEQMRHVPVLANFIETPALRSPVRTMNEYLDQTVADYFAKVDNDIVMPPHWLRVMLDAMAQGVSAGLELLGVEQGMSGKLPLEEDPLLDSLHPRSYEPARHVGGVGLFKTSAFLTRPRVRPNGRFGFTEWQHEHQPVCGWLSPDILMTDLSRLPVKPYRALSEEYVKKNWQRDWPKSDSLRSFYWDWWYKQEQVEA
jgi:glycosyltransferase involved in cell wall biosynthesis